MFFLSDGQAQHGPYDAATVIAWAASCSSHEGWWVWDGTTWNGLTAWLATASSDVPVAPKRVRPPNPLSTIRPRIVPYVIRPNGEGETILVPKATSRAILILDEGEAAVVPELNGGSSLEEILRSTAATPNSGSGAVHSILRRLYREGLLEFKDGEEETRFCDVLGETTGSRPTGSPRRRVPSPPYRDGFRILRGLRRIGSLLGSVTGQAWSGLAVVLTLVAFPLDPLIDPFEIDSSRLTALIFHIAVFSTLALFRWNLLAAGLASHGVHVDRGRFVFSPFSVARAFPAGYFSAADRQGRSRIIRTALLFPFTVTAVAVAALVLDFGFTWWYRIGWDAIIFVLLDLRPWGDSSGTLLGRTWIGAGDRKHAAAFFRRGFLRRALDFRSAAFAGETRLVGLFVAGAAWFGLAFAVLHAYAFPSAGSLFSDLVRPRPAGPWPAMVEALAAGWFLVGLLVGLCVPIVLFLLPLFRNLAAILPARKAARATTSPAENPLLKSHVFLEGMDAGDRESFRRAFSAVTFCKGATLVKQGDVADAFYILLEGEAAVVREHPSGHAEILNRLGPGDGFGEQGLLETGRRNATVRARSKGLAARLSAADFEKWRGASPANAERLTAFLRTLAVLRKNEAFRLLDADTITWLVSRLQIMTIPQGQVIIEEGKQGAEMFLIREGRFSAWQGGRQIGLIEAPAFFGEMALLHDRPRNATVRAETEGVLYRLAVDDFRDLMFSSFGFHAAAERVAETRELVP